MYSGPLYVDDEVVVCNHGGIFTFQHMCDWIPRKSVLDGYRVTISMIKQHDIFYKIVKI